MSATSTHGPAICTIIAKNYLAYARTLAESFSTQHPDGRVFVLLVDRPDDCFDPGGEPFTVVMAEELGIPAFSQMAFRYSVLELCTAVKPFLLEYLFERYGLEHLIYLDPDIACYRPLTPLLEPLRTHQIVLTPHLLEPLDDDRTPREVEILQAGAYNLGCIGVARGPQLLPFLRWWQRRLVRDCVVDIGRGLFVDQRWVDLVPSLFPSVAIVRDPGCNVAYWNLTHRRVSPEGGWTAGGSPLRFFHFSGITLDDLNAISRHQNRVTLEEMPALRPLLENYRDRLLAHGHASTRTWSYSYETFDNGVPIPEIARQLWRTHGGEDRWENPFATGIPESFFAWLNEEAHPKLRSPLLVTNLALAIYRIRLDLQQAFPDVLNTHRRGFVGWFAHDAERQHALHAAFVRPMRERALGLSPARGDGAGGAPPRTIAGRLSRALWGEGPPPQEELLVGRPTLSRRIYYGIRNPLRRLGLHHAAKHLIGVERATRLLEVMVLNVAEPRAPIRAVEPIINALVAPAVALLEPGLNIVGYFSHPTGVGEVARALSAALITAGMPLAQLDVSATGQLAASPYDSTLLCVNADVTPDVRAALGPGALHGRRTVGFWHWETERFPREWCNRFALVDEVWVASDFVRRAVAPLAPVPVLTMGLPVALCAPADLGRADLGLPSSRFLWLFAFDMRSSVERKNPAAVVAAFRRAFGAGSPSAHLVVKANHLDEYPEAAAQLREAVEAVGGTLIGRTMGRPEVAALYAACDGYVSLHRSEGFGLTIAEAMLLGKPVVATGYSGNMEFMRPENSFLVGYRLCTIERSIGSYYRAGNQWAEPDVAEAADLMAAVVSDPGEAQRRGARAAADLRARFAPDIIARAVAERLDVLRHAARI
jgi:glycosyltransferase involved in cell wall biosynthesis